MQIMDEQEAAFFERGARLEQHLQSILRLCSGSNGSRRTMFGSGAMSGCAPLAALGQTREAVCEYLAGPVQARIIISCHLRGQKMCPSCEQLLRAVRATVGLEQAFRALLRGRARLGRLHRAPKRRRPGSSGQCLKLYVFSRDLKSVRKLWSTSRASEAEAFLQAAAITIATR